MYRFVIFVFVMSFSSFCWAQDTFSIVAVDPETGEVGSAGASCVDLDQFGLTHDDFLGQLIPGVGAINTQAYYDEKNQENATYRMVLGESPTEIIDWLVQNDIQTSPQYRQYGIAAIINGEAQTAAHTGEATDDYKNHVLGSNYTIQGNILLGQKVLDSMEARFLNEKGDLACKLMAALQGANMVGADTRCEPFGTSSLFAFVKVSQPHDVIGQPSLNVSVRTSQNDGIEPIDALQTKFDEVHGCMLSNVKGVTEDDIKGYSVYPNPVSDYLKIQALEDKNCKYFIYDGTGRLVVEDELSQTQSIDVRHWNKGEYLLKIIGLSSSFSKVIIVE